MGERAKFSILSQFLKVMYTDFADFHANVTECVCLCLRYGLQSQAEWHVGATISREDTHATSPPMPTLINTVWPFGRQCLAFYNEFPSGAADVNVTHSQLQFELGGGKVRGRRSGHHVCVCPLMIDKVNRHKMPLMKMSEGGGYSRNGGLK